MSSSRADIRTTISADNSELRRVIRQSVGDFNLFERAGQRASRNLSSGFRSLAAGLGAALGFREIIRSTIDAEQASAKLDAVLESTGGAAGVTKEQVKALADELQRTTKFEDDAVVAAAAMALRFREISGEVFPDVIRLGADLATVMGTDLTAAVNLLGKAANDPVRGLRFLREAGVKLNPTLKAMVENLVASGRSAEASKILFDELNKSIGGQAKNAADTFGGALDQLKNAVGNLLEGEGGTLDGAKEGVQSLTRTLNDPAVKEGVSIITGAVLKLVEVLAKAAGGLALFIKDIRSLFADDTLDELEEKLRKLEERAEFQKRGGFGLKRDNANTEAAIAETKALIAAKRAEAEKTAAAKKHADDVKGINASRVANETAHAARLRDAREKITDDLRAQLERQRTLYKDLLDDAKKAQGEREKIEEEFDEALERRGRGTGPDEQASFLDAAILTGRARTALNAGDFEEAIRIAREATKALDEVQEAGKASSLALQGQQKQINEVAKAAGAALEQQAVNTAGAALDRIREISAEAAKIAEVPFTFTVDETGAISAVDALIKKLQEQANGRKIVVPVVVGGSTPPSGPIPDVPVIVNRARGGRTSGPQLYQVGEGSDPVEWIIPRDPRYRARAVALLLDAAKNIMPRFAMGGVVPAPRVSMGRIPALAAGGKIGGGISGGGTPVHLHLGGRSFELAADIDVAGALRSYIGHVHRKHGGRR